MGADRAVQITFAGKRRIAGTASQYVARAGQRR
jgi:hypothetical protein